MAGFQEGSFPDSSADGEISAARPVSQPTRRVGGLALGHSVDAFAYIAAYS